MMNREKLESCLVIEQQINDKILKEEELSSKIKSGIGIYKYIKNDFNMRIFELGLYF